MPRPCPEAPKPAGHHAAPAEGQPCAASSSISITTTEGPGSLAHPQVPGRLCSWSGDPSLTPKVGI